MSPRAAAPWRRSKQHVTPGHRPPGPPRHRCWGWWRRDRPPWVSLPSRPGESILLEVVNAASVSPQLGFPGMGTVARLPLYTSKAHTGIPELTPTKPSPTF